MCIDVVAALTSIITGYHQRIAKLEEEKYDNEMEVARRELEIMSSSFSIIWVPPRCHHVASLSLVSHRPDAVLSSSSELQTICQMYWQRIYELEGDKYELERGSEIKKMEEYYDRMYVCEGQKWDLEHEVRKRDYECIKSAMLWSMLPDPFPDVQAVALMCVALVWTEREHRIPTCACVNIAHVNYKALNVIRIHECPGAADDQQPTHEYVKPTLKKVSKYENKFAKLQKKAAEFNFRNQLKVVKKKEFTLEEEDKEKKPDWSKGKPGDQKVKEEEVEA
ncbi:Troponin I [Papilio xuthus]|uniref:Troponin I n=1 Tax=Papilio xuthus TaxID=66420 RepID=A0A194Q618_PAPXU|nr:Troponin I [Papilio xuthus]